MVFSLGGSEPAAPEKKNGPLLVHTGRDPGN
jgi:hypothetical protein